MDYEVTILQIPQCFVYRVPPASSAAGYKAKDWDLQNPIWQGRLVVSTLKGMCIVRLMNGDGTEFAICPVNNAKSVEKVLDSSRYFAIRISDGTGKTAVIGLGFAERNTAFDFSASLLDQQKKVTQEKEIAAARSRRAQEPAVDYSLPQGKTISIGLKMKPSAKASSRPSSRRRNDDDDDDDDDFFLPPPPSAHPTSGTAPATTYSTSGSFFEPQRTSAPGPSSSLLTTPTSSLVSTTPTTTTTTTPSSSGLDSLLEIPSQAPSPYGGLTSPYGGLTTAPSPYGGLMTATPGIQPLPFGTAPTTPSPSPFATPSILPPTGGPPSPFGLATPSSTSPFGLAPTGASPSPFGLTPTGASPSPFGLTPTGASPSPFGLTPTGVSATPSPFGFTGAPAPSPFGIGSSPSPFGSAPTTQTNNFGLF